MPIFLAGIKLKGTKTTIIQDRSLKKYGQFSRILDNTKNEFFFPRNFQVSDLVSRACQAHLWGVSPFFLRLTVLLASITKTTLTHWERPTRWSIAL